MRYHKKLMNGGRKYMWHKGHEFDDIASRICNKENLFIIFGAGTFGKAFVEEFGNELNITCFVDSNKSKQGTVVCGLSVRSPDDLDPTQGEMVLVSTGWTGEVFGLLQKKGYVKNKDFFHIDEFMTIYKMYRENLLYVSNLSINITEYCSLKCRKCAVLNPYIQNKVHLSPKEVQKSLDMYFNWVDEVSVLGLGGGDSMVHPQFNDILELVGKRYYGRQIHHIEVYSNAVIRPDDRSLNLFKKYDVIYRFTDYGEAAFEKQKTKEIMKILENNGISYDHAKFEKWSDYGYPQKSNGIPKEKLREFYKSCDRRSCQGIWGTKLFYCGLAIWAQRAGYCEVVETDYVDLSRKDLDKKELMEFMLGYNERGYLEYCQKCNGGPNINQKYVVPGEQLI